MSAAASSTSTHLLQDFVGDFYFHSRRLLLHNPLYQPPSTATGAASPISAAEQYPGDNSFDANVVMVLSVLLCALICSLGLNSIIKCALKCSNFVAPGNNSHNNNSSANTGVKKKALKTFPTVIYSEDLNPPGLDTECVICLSEFAVGDRVRLLPKCQHGFHVRCIDKWLSSHSSCPKCRHNLIETCQKIVGFGHASSSDPVLVLPPLQETIVRITPLAPEALVRNYRGNI